jgi:type I restriction enzyme, S subunit
MSFPRYPKYKDSGVEWLGQVPEHWEVKRLKYLGEAIIGLTYDPSNVVGVGSGTLVLRSSNVQGGQIVLDDNVYVSSAIPEQLVTKPGDILICSRNGSRALIGKNAKITQEAAGMTFGAFMTAIMGSLDAHTSMSTRALNSERVQSGLKDILLNHAALYESLRTPVPAP